MTQAIARAVAAPSMRARPHGTINSLQAGRGIAAVAVVGHHAALAAHDFGGPFSGYRPFSFGYLGVDFFFALSGFIIYHSTVGRQRGPSKYAVARIRRVYFPYLPVGAGMALLYALAPTISATAHAWRWLPSLTLAPVDAAPALTVAWTLQHEVLFYLLFGLFYFADMLWIGLAAWALCIVGFGRHLPFQTINLEFFFGIGAAVLYRQRRAYPPLILLTFPPIVLWAYFGGLESDRILIGFAAAFLIGPLAQMERARLFSVPYWLVALGAASYSIYLVHVPVISLAARAVRGSWPIFLLAVVAGVLGGFLYHFFIEQRLVARRTNPEVFA